MSRADESFLTVSWDKITGSQTEVSGGYAKITSEVDIELLVYKLIGLSYTPVNLKVYKMKGGSLQPPTFQQEHGVPDNLKEILKQKLNEILAMPAVTIGVTATVGVAFY